MRNYFGAFDFVAFRSPDGESAPHLTVVRDVGRLAYIDGLRGIAALGVILCHTALLTPMWANVLASPGTVPLPWLAHALVDGAHGVDLFFVLSGFCLAYPSLVRFHARGYAAFDIVHFATHRIVRILPPYYLATGLFLILAVASWLHSGHFRTPGTDDFRLPDVLGQLLLLDRGVHLATPPFWTLIVEMRWYLFFPIVLFVFVRAPRVFGVLLCALLIAYWCTRMHDLDIGVAPAFLLGVLAADLDIREHPIRRYALPLAGAALILALLIEPAVTMPNILGVDVQGFLWQANPAWHLTAFFAVLAAGRVASLRNLLSLPLPVFLGGASYSIYLMHYPIVAFVAYLVLTHNRLDGFVATFLAAVTGGILFWALVERHVCGGPLRDRARAAVAPVIARCVRWLGLPPTVDPGVRSPQVETG